MRHHILKSFPDRFEALLSDQLKGECRYNRDRDFQQWDTVTLVEGTQWGDKFFETGKTKNAVISYVDTFTPDEDFVVLSYENVGILISDEFYDTNQVTSASGVIVYSNELSKSILKKE